MQPTISTPRGLRANADGELYTADIVGMGSLGGVPGATTTGAGSALGLLLISAVPCYVHYKTRLV
jgi:hypothetical protein